MKKTFVMAAAMLISIATMAQPKTKTTKYKTKKDSGHMMGKDSMSMDMNSDSTTSKWHSNKKMKMKSKSKMSKDSTSTME